MPVVVVSIRLLLAVMHGQEDDEISNEVGQECTPSAIRL
jgi:hypothetical protein